MIFKILANHKVHVPSLHSFLIVINKYSFESFYFFNLTFFWYVETLSSDFIIKIDYSVIHRLLICEPSSQTLVKYPSLHFPLITINFITLAIDIVCKVACIRKKLSVLI